MRSAFAGDLEFATSVTDLIRKTKDEVLESIEEAKAGNAAVEKSLKELDADMTATLVGKLVELDERMKIFLACPRPLISPSPLSSSSQNSCS